MRSCHLENCAKLTKKQDNLLPLVAAALTPRQRDVARLLLCAYSDAMMGEALGISQGTLKVHLAAMCAKARIHPPNRVRLAIALLARS